MILKIIIILLIIGLLISLATGLTFLFKDVGTTRRTMHSLGVRVSLAAALVACIVFGVLTGQLQMGAPWDAIKHPDYERLKAQHSDSQSKAETETQKMSPKAAGAPAENK